MKGLSAKVFRTYNASHTFQKQLEKLTNKEESIPDKMLSFNRANRDVAVLCNHQRAAPKGHEQQMGRIQDRVNIHTRYIFLYLLTNACMVDPCSEIPTHEDPKADL